MGVVGLTGKNRYPTFVGAEPSGARDRKNRDRAGLAGAGVGWIGTRVGFTGAGVGCTGDSVGRTGAGVGWTGARVGFTGARVGFTGDRVGLTGAGVGLTGAGVGFTGDRVGLTGAGVGFISVLPMPVDGIGLVGAAVGARVGCMEPATGRPNCMEMLALAGTIRVSIFCTRMTNLLFSSLTMGKVYEPFALSLATRFDFAYPMPGALVDTITWSPPSNVSKLFPLLRLKWM